MLRFSRSHIYLVRTSVEGIECFKSCLAEPNVNFVSQALVRMEMNCLLGKPCWKIHNHQSRSEISVADNPRFFHINNYVVRFNVSIAAGCIQFTDQLTL